MSKAKPGRTPEQPLDPSDESHLELEDSSDGSTHHVDPEAVEAEGAEQSPQGSAMALGDSSAGGTTTGGFETLLGNLVVQAGLVTPEELELCSSLLDESHSDIAQPQTLGDLLVQNEFVTQRQLRRLRDEFEAKRSSQRIPGYRIKRKLGSGAMATVFQARQISLDRLVAIKVLPKKFSDNPRFVDRFYKEGRAAAKLNHPNIVGAYDVGKAGDHHYFVMEYVPGHTVHELITKHRRVDEGQAISVVRQVAMALQHAHERGFVHRDIKPKNIMISRDGVVKLADLGLARAVTDDEAARAEAGRAYGTPYYISPEQIRGELQIGPAADIYGLGATFYHMVTGRLPFEGKNPSAVMHKHLKEELTPPDHINPKLTAGCAQVIEMMMAKEVAERYQNADDLLVDLDLVAEGEPPHFAHRQLDLSDIATSEVELTPVVKDAPSTGGIADNPLAMLLLLVAVVSVLLNVVLLVLMVMK